MRERIRKKAIEAETSLFTLVCQFSSHLVSVTVLLSKSTKFSPPLSAASNFRTVENNGAKKRAKIARVRSGQLLL